MFVTLTVAIWVSKPNFLGGYISISHISIVNVGLTFGYAQVILPLPYKYITEGLKMDNKNIIIALLIIIVVILTAMVAMVLMPSSSAQKDSKVSIACNKTLYVGDDVTVKLTDLNKTPIENAVVKVVVKDKGGDVVVNESLKTNSKGKAKLDLELDAGKYTVNATFDGNENFTGNSTTKKITVEEIVVEEEVSQPVEESTQSSTSSQPSEYGSYINDEWVSMSEAEYAERYPALYHMQTLDEGRYDEYHPEMYEVDKENGRI